MTPHTAIATYLAAQLAGYTLNTNVFAGPMQPASYTGIPAACIFCLASGGRAPAAYMHSDRKHFMQPRVQVLIRGAKEAHMAGQATAWSVLNTLRGAASAAIAGYLNVEVSESAPNYLGEDDEGYPMWSVNATLWAIQS